jgi:hypothetical protein
VARAACVVAIVLVVASCSSSGAGANIPNGAHVAGGGCGSTTLYRSASQPWAAAADGPTDLVQATGHLDAVRAFIFGYPLRAGDPTDPANKTLWVVRTPRDGSEQLIRGHPLGAPTPSVELRQPADSSPGEIYPSIVNVPSPACWQFTLSWHGNNDTIERPYGA